MSDQDPAIAVIPPPSRSLAPAQPPAGVAVEVVSTPPRQARQPGRRRRALSLRVRLVLWNVAVLSVVLVLFGVSLYAFLAWTLDRQITESLPQQYSQIDASTNRFLVLRGPGGEQTLVPNQRPDTFSSDELEIFVQIAGLDGSVPPGGRSSNLRGNFLPLTTEVLAAVREGQMVMEREVLVGGQRMRLFSGPLLGPTERGTGVIGIIQVARSLERVEGMLTQLRILLIGGGVISLLVAVVVGLALSGAALAPLDRLAQAARDIGASRDFSRRVQRPGPDDEVGKLATTFNEMLAQLQAAHNSLASTLETQRRFVADASHELRTPLTTIRGNVGLLRRVAEVDPADREAALADIDAEAARMARLVNQMLSLARADASLAISHQPVDLAAVVHDVGRQLMLLAAAAGLTASTGPVEPARVLGHPDALRQLLLILVDNAVKYTPPPGTVTLSLTHADGQAEVRVSDTGVGIAPEHLEHIFERFYRADPARAGDSAGLGLAIAHWLVDSHNGRITVSSTPGQGSTFLVSLPLLPAS